MHDSIHRTASTQGRLSNRPSGYTSSRLTSRLANHFSSHFPDSFSSKLSSGVPGALPRRQPVLALLAFTLFALLAGTPLHAAGPHREIQWEALVPKGWNPAKDLQALDLASLDDADPRAAEAMEKVKALWDAAPTEPTLAGRKVRLPGFVIPLERKGERVTEFLLVPYFGACVHSPPPPANQIVRAVSAKPLGKMQTMDAVWVSGTLDLERAESPWGTSGYRITVDKVAPYRQPD